MNVRRLLPAILLFSATALASAQLSFTSAVDLALRNSSRVKAAEADAHKALATLQESHDVYIPAVMIGSGLGYTYGFPVGQPTVYNASLQSLVFDYSQRNYIRASRLGLEAANTSLRDVRQQVAEDAASTYLAVDSGLMKMSALKEEEQFAGQVTTIVSDRLAAGQDPAIELTRAQLNAAQIRLHRIQVEDELRTQQDHLARITGMSSLLLQTDHSSIPEVTHDGSVPDEAVLPLSVQSAYANADSHLQQAFGDERKMYRPTVALGLQYSRFARFNNYEDFYRNFQVNNFQAGIQLNLPVFDFTRRAHARASLADATRLRHEADYARQQFFEGRLKLVNQQNELQARTEVARLQRQFAQDQLDIVGLQLRVGNPNGQPVTPKDEGNAHIEERQRYLDTLDADLQLRQAEISLLRSTGRLESWLQRAIEPGKSAVTAAPAAP